MSALTTNTLFYGDNLPILRDHIDTESVDLIYLNPPFNSNRSCNVLFRDENGHEAEAATAGVYHSAGWNRDYPRLQILTIADLFNGAEAKMPPYALTFRQAQKVKPDEPVQEELF